MAWIIGFASDEQIREIEDAGFVVDTVAKECEDILRETYPIAEDESQHMVWVSTDQELVDVLDCRDLRLAAERQKKTAER